MPRAIGRITLVAVGKLRGAHWQAAQDEYRRRLERYTRFELVEVKDMVGRGLPDAVAVQREGEQLLAAAAPAGRIILLDVAGREMSSPELADYVGAQIERYDHAAFLIGGPLGFSEATTAAAHDRIALSRLTLPHELARVVWLEQLYRALTILNGEPYHK